MTDLLPVRGSPGSPYTRKLLALLRYRRIPYKYMQTMQEGLPEPKVKLIPVVYFTGDNGELDPVVDSTPIIRRLETEYPGRSVIPEDPVMRFLDTLLEDYGDEWLTKAMFHYRWYYADDIDMAGAVLPHYADVTESDDKLRAMKKMFSDRQISRLYVVGSNDTTAVVIEDSYKRFLESLNNHLRNFPFIMGKRPGSADFGCFGQLTQLVQFDPTPSSIAIKSHPRIHAWVSKMDDLSGLEPMDDEFLSTDNLPATMSALLGEVGRTYVPVMLANGDALENGKDQVRTIVEGREWVAEPFPYQGKCLQGLRIEYARLEQPDRNRLDAILKGTGCEKLLDKPARS